MRYWGEEIGSPFDDEKDGEGFRMAHWNARKYGMNVKLKSFLGLTYRAESRKAWSMDTDAFWRYQRDRFLEIYHFARAKVPFYRERLHLYPVLEDKGQDVRKVLQGLPILRKEEVRRHNALFWPNPLPRFIKFHQTSGTSGTPLTLAMNLKEKGRQQAIFDEWKRRIAGRSSLRTLNLVGAMTPSSKEGEIYYMDQATGQAFLSIYSLNKENRDAVIRLFHRFNPQYIYGYASAIYQLALLVGDALTRGKEDRVAVSTAEVLHPHWIGEIEDFLVRRIYNFYSSQEGCHGAMSCESGKLHVHPFFGIVEIVDEEGLPVGEGEVGRVLVTGLLRKSMPLIRFDLGDRAVSTSFSSHCTCGVKWPTIGAVDGRMEDLLITRDGRAFSMMNLVSSIAGSREIGEMQGVKEFQLVQTDYEKFKVHVVEEGDHAVDHAMLEKEVTERLRKRIQADDLEVEFHYSDRIDRGPNGKFKAFIREMS